MLSTDLRAQVEKHEYFSIDIFDTLLIRAAHHPADIFRMISPDFKNKYNVDFFSARVDAERTARDIARDNGYPEVTLDGIYDVIRRRFNISYPDISALAATELDLEEAFAFISPLGREILSEIRRNGKRFVLSSDMYLPVTAIERLLAKIGLEGHERIFVSSELQLTKHDGAMFPEVVRHFKARPEQVLHIGDNPHSDFRQPISAGLHAYLQPAYREIFTEHSTFNRTALFRGHSPYKVAINALFAIEHHQLARRIVQHRCTREEYFRAFGWLVVAPMMLALSFWIESEWEKGEFEHVAFLARDGKLPLRVFSEVCPHLAQRTSYIAASRRLLTRNLGTLSPTEIGNFYSHVVAKTGHDLLDQLDASQSLRQRLEELGYDLNHRLTDGGRELLAAIGENAGLLVEKQVERIEIIQGYYRSSLHQDRIAIFDLGWRGSLQASLVQGVPDLRTRLTGLYFGTNWRAESMLLRSGASYSSFTMSNGQPDHLRVGCEEHTDVIEFIFAGDHGSVTDIHRSPSGDYVWNLAPVSFAEREMQQWAKIIQDGAMEAVRAVTATIPRGTLKRLSSRAEILSDFFGFLGAPTRYDADKFRSVRIFSGIGDEKGIPLVGEKSLFPWHGYAASRWRSAFTVLLNRRDRGLLRAIVGLYHRSALARRIYRRLSGR